MNSSALFILGGIVIALNIVGVFLDFNLNPLKRTIKYRLKRLSNWFVIGITYAFIYMGRYHLSVLNTDAYRSRLNLSKTELGWVFTLGFWAYSASLPFTGYIIANLDGKKVLILGSLGSGLMNLIVGLTYYTRKDVPGFALLTTFVVMNFAFQGLCTSAIPQLNSRWYKSKEAGNFSGVFSVLTSTGYFLALNIGAVIVSSSQWWFFIFLVPAGGLILWNIMVWLFVTSPPSSHVQNPLHDEFAFAKEKESNLHQANIEMRDMSTIAAPSPTLPAATTHGVSPTTSPTVSPNTSPSVSPSSSPTLTPREHNPRPTHTVMRNTTVVAFDRSEEDTSVGSELASQGDVSVDGKELSVFRKILLLIWKNNQSLGTIFFLGFAKESLLSWFPSFLEDVYDCPPDSMIYVITSCGLTLASMFGAVIVGIIFDKLFGSRRNPVYILCAVLYTTSFFILAFAPNAISACILLCFGGVWLLGSFSLVAFSAALDLNDKNTNEAASATNSKETKALTSSEKTVNNTTSVNNDDAPATSTTQLTTKPTTTTTTDLTEKKKKKSDKSSSVTFFSCMLGLFQYVGSGLSGILGAKVIENLGYTAWCYMLAAICFASVLPVILFSPAFIYFVNRAKAIVVQK